MFKGFEKTLTELQHIGSEIPRISVMGRQYEVDIELMLEKDGIKIDTIPLADTGINAWISMSAKILYIDIDLADKDWMERRYRFTLAEEFAHSILHKDIFKNIDTPEAWVAQWNKLTDEQYSRLDKQAKELAGILLMPEDKFKERMIELRNNFTNIEKVCSPITIEQQAHITNNVIRTLMCDFNVNQNPCQIRMQRLTHPKTLFDLPPFYKKR